MKYRIKTIYTLQTHTHARTHNFLLRPFLKCLNSSPFQRESGKRRVTAPGESTVFSSPQFFIALRRPSFLSFLIFYVFLRFFFSEKTSFHLLFYLLYFHKHFKMIISGFIFKAKQLTLIFVLTEHVLYKNRKRISKEKQYMKEIKITQIRTFQKVGRNNEVLNKSIFSNCCYLE